MLCYILSSSYNSVAVRGGNEFIVNVGLILGNEKFKKITDHVKS